MSLLIIGSVAYDSIATPAASRQRVIGGSGVYAACAASFFSPVNLVGVVGGDWKNEHTEFLKNRKIDIRGLEVRPNELTLYWSGRYFENMDNRETLEIQPNVMGKTYIPIVPDDYKNSDIVFLANGSPSTHLALLEQLTAPSLVIADTMDFYIDGERNKLDELLKKIDGLVVNESEIRLLTGETDLMAAARKGLDAGPKFLIIKKGGSGAFYLSRSEMYILPAYPCCTVVDPTGAGDSFAGAFAGSLAQCGRFDAAAVKNALLAATVTASFNVEGFSLERLERVTPDELKQRLDAFREMVRF